MKKRKSKISRIGVIFIIIVILSDVISLFVSDMVEVSQYAAILLPTVLLAVLYKVNLKERFKIKRFKLESLGELLVLVVAIIPVSTFIAHLTTLIFGENPVGIDAVLKSMNLTPFWLFFAFALTPAICEELMFRGLLLDRKAGLSIHKLALLNGLMFAMFHIGYNQLFYTFWIGTVLGYVAVITNSILPVILMHFLNNSYALALYLLPIKEGSFINKVLGGETPTALLEVIPMFIFAVISFMVVIRSINKLKKIYGYSDISRLEENHDDLVICNSESKLRAYLPQIIFGLYVVTLNLLINTFNITL